MNSLWDAVSQAADRCVNAIAIERADRSMSYGELREEALGMAGQMARAGVTGAVPIVSDGSLSSYVGYLACALLPGVVPVPVSEHLPSSRHRTVVERVGARHKLVPGGQRHLLVEVPGIGGADTHPIQRRLAEGAYVLFTSGSTGLPKGVIVEEDNLASYVSRTVRRTVVSPASRVSQTFDLSFDLSVWGMALAWSNTLPLVLPAPSALMNPLRYLRENQISHVLAVPSLIRQCSAVARSKVAPLPSTLTFSAFCGEALTWGDVQQWKIFAPDSEIWNYYGPTELTVSCSSYLVNPDEINQHNKADLVSLGTLDDGFEAAVLDESAELANRGELVVRGAGRFPGYVNASDNIGRFWSGVNGTHHQNEAQVKPTDWYRTGDLVERRGSLYTFLGRADDQVKISGYRVELREVEWQASRMADVKESVAFVIDGSQGPSLALACTTSPGLVEARVLSELRAHLAWYAVPKKVFFLHHFPMTENGKTDRAKVARICQGLEIN